MRLQQLKYVIAVAEHQSISAAAKTLYTSRPYISNIIHEVENEIQRKLFVRSSKGIKTTMEGEFFVADARVVVQQMIDLENKYCKEPGNTELLMKIVKKSTIA